MTTAKDTPFQRKPRAHAFIAAALAAALSAGLALPPAAAQAQALTKINISYQPSLYWALPFYIAAEKGWWKDVGLDASFVTFPAGAPQVAAAQAGSWDVGGTGSVPAVLGAARFGLLTVGITNDESKTNAMMTRADKVAAIQKDPAALKGQKLLLTTNSTADFAARNCLAKWGLKSSDMQFVNLGQAQIISAVMANTSDVVGVWAPFTYTLEEKAGAKVLCSGADAGAMVPGALVVRPAFAKEHPDLVAKALAVYLRGWSWAKAHPKEARAMTKAFYAAGGVEASDSAIDQEFALRPTFGLTEQVKLMDRAKGASELDGWLGRIGGFMAEVGTIPAAPEAKSYVDESFMKTVAADPKLKAFATEFDKTN
ncbi:ABC transporter substrate-binding protein [Xanthobacter autotrophicus DSM 431]|uniref:ABC transporter substrate-binding protein n=1 Tax=Xanthobacter nonsaccharivorans TaxID=3119912 RepID=UPI00372CD460